MMPPRQTVTNTVVQRSTNVRYRISVGLIAMSLGLMCVSLAIGLFTLPAGLAPALFIAAPPTVHLASTSATAVTLTWTAPGDDDTSGQASSYDIRYSTNPITAATFDTANAVSDAPAPAPAGATESYTVANLQPGTTYYFAIKATDDAGNTSTISNVATQTTASLAAACVPVYSCAEWSACSAGQQVRTCTVTNGCPSGLDAPVTTQSCTIPSDTTPAPSVGGEPVRITNHILVAGLAPGGQPLIRVINPQTKKVTKEFLAFSKSNTKGVNVAVGDIDGDHQADIIAGTGAGSDPLVKVFSERGTLKFSFNPYPTTKGSGVSVAAADVNGDGVDDIVTVPAKSASQVRVYSYQSATKRFTSIAQGFAFNQQNAGGFTLAAGDMNNDGRAEIAVAPLKNAKTVVIMQLSGKSLKKTSSLTPYPLTFSTGLRLAIGDVTGDGRAELLTTAGAGYYAHVKAWTLSGKSVGAFLPAGTTFFGGVDLATLDVNQDGRDEVITGNLSRGDSTVRYFRYNGTTKSFSRIASFLVWPKTVKLGIRLAGG